MTNIEKIKEAFDDKGNSDKFTTEHGDPYRYDDEHPRTPIAQLVFSEDGYLTSDGEKALWEIIEERNVSKMCLAAKILICEEFAQNTKGNYSTIYMWR